MMDQTPAHESHNPDLLKFIPADARRIIEIGCSAGALAREFKKAAPEADYLGVEIDPAYAELARRHCDRVLVLNLEQADNAFWHSAADRDCWIFGDVLEHFQDPWTILRRIRAVIPTNGSIVACVPNMQHWSMQVRLNIGALNYEASGLMDRTHLRWFTRQTLIQLFADTGFTFTAGFPRVFPEPQRDAFLPLLEQMAKLAGVDPKQAVADALPLQYVVKAVPK
jgi:2-polyprenyl-3-methyl-5-hydroxy-6-metoxy-1,4-benzoquinol methylase